MCSKIANYSVSFTPQWPYEQQTFTERKVDVYWTKQQTFTEWNSRHLL